MVYFIYSECVLHIFVITKSSAMTYKRLLIQQYKKDGSTESDVGDTVDTQASYKVVCQEFPFKFMPETKELPSRKWYDKDGEDVYIPSDGLKLEAYDIEAKFLYVGTQKDMTTDIEGFIKFICGRDQNGSPLLKVYDEYTKTGRKGIYVKEVDNELLAYDDLNSHVIGVFKVKFRVTEPASKITLTKPTV